MKKTISLIVVLNFLLVSGSLGQTSVRDLIPLQTNKADVVKALGEGRAIEANKLHYDLQNEEVTFTFYDGGCDASVEEKFGISKDSVIETKVSPKITPYLGDLLKQNDISRNRTEDLFGEFVDGAAIYVAPKHGLVFVSVVDVVNTLYYIPKDKNLPECLVNRMDAGVGFTLFRWDFVDDPFVPWIHHGLVDEFYLPLPLTVERARLDSYAEMLSRWSHRNLEGKIILEAGKELKQKQIPIIISRIKKYLTIEKGVSPARLNFSIVDMPQKGSRVSLYLAYPKGYGEKQPMP